MRPLNDIGDHPEALFAFAIAEMTAGRDIILVLITDIEGSSSRRIGTPMIVTEDGRYAGYVSSGCLDADIAVQALDTLKTGKPHASRYGRGSPYIDLRLPCGGGLDVLFIPRPDLAELQNVRSDLVNRCPALLRLEFMHPACRDNPLKFPYAPQLRVLIFGESREALALQSVAWVSGVAPVMMTELGSRDLDMWTAVVLMFHDHSKEIDILRHAVKTRAFYIGAMGSPHSQAERLKALDVIGVSKAELARINGPIGLVRSTRDAGRLAISVLAEIFEVDRVRKPSR